MFPEVSLSNKSSLYRLSHIIMFPRTSNVLSLLQIKPAQCRLTHLGKEEHENQSTIYRTTSVSWTFKTRVNCVRNVLFPMFYTCWKPTRACSCSYLKVICPCLKIKLREITVAICTKQSSEAASRHNFSVFQLPAKTKISGFVCISQGKHIVKSLKTNKNLCLKMPNHCILK